MRDGSAAAVRRAKRSLRGELGPRGRRAERGVLARGEALTRGLQRAHRGLDADLFRRRPWLPRDRRGVHPDSHERFPVIVVAVVASHRAGMRDAREPAPGGARNLAWSRCAIRVLRSGAARFACVGGRRGSPTKSVRPHHRKTKRRFVRENFHLVVNKNQDGYGYFGKISSATFWTPGYVSPVHTTSKPASRRRLNTCHGPG